MIATGDPVTDPKSGVTTPRINLGVALAGPLGCADPRGEGCILNQFTASSSADYNTWDPAWDPASGNLTADPDFIEGYYLGRKSTGQATDSPCIDAGSADVNDPNVALVGTTTSTDGTPDVGRVDLGYHYTKGLTSYRLTVSVVPDPNDGLPHGSVQPTYAVVYEGASHQRGDPAGPSRWGLQGQEVDWHRRRCLHGPGQSGHGDQGYAGDGAVCVGGQDTRSR